MKILTRKLTTLALALAAATGSTLSLAQSTDGYHDIQVFPLVVDSGTFTQRFTFRNPNTASITIVPRFFPGTGTSQATSIVCPSFVIPAQKELVITSLRTMCPALATGNQHGFLYTSETDSANLPYAAYSRVTNFAGNGFSEEGFPAHTFTSADTVVTGIRRLAATSNTPAYQSNCFIANLNDISPMATPISTTVAYTIYDSNSATIGSGTVALTPGKITRLLDVFATGGVVQSEVNDAQIKFEELSPGEPALMTYCTVQDNTSFGADFRIGKQELGSGGLSSPTDVVGAQDNHVARETLVNVDSLARNFEINAGANSNTHVLYFRHPDFVQCELIDPATGVRALSTYGLELRMLDQNGLAVAGGDGSTGWGKVYLGDKSDRNAGSNTRYTIEVEADTSSAVVRPYKLHCQSGSGHTLGDLIRYKEAANRF